MRKIIVHEFITLDGVIQAPGDKNEDRDGGFEHGGWTVPFWHDGMGRHFDKAMRDADTFLLGRKTWEIHGTAFEPLNDDPFGNIMNSMHKIVVSSTLESASLWRNSDIIGENVVTEVKKLKEQEGKNILVDGSSVLLKTLFENELVDKISLHIYPVVLGAGKKLFPEGKKIDLKLTHSESVPTGVIYTEYDVLRGGGQNGK